MIYEDFTKIIFQLSSNMHLISSSAFHREIFPEGTDGMANSVDTDQICVCTVCLFPTNWTPGLYIQQKDTDTIGIYLKGTASLTISMFYMKELSEPWILIPVLSKLVEKYGSYGHLNICKWTLMEAAILQAL